MASGETGEFYCGTYIRGRFRWSTQAVSGGHNVTVAMDVYRTNIYNGDIAWNRQMDYLYIDGVQAGEWYNTTISNQRTWHQLFQATRFVAHTGEKKVVLGWATTCTASYYNGSWFMHEDNEWPANRPITLEALGQPASGLSVSPGDKTWDGIKISGSLSSWGVSSGPNYVALAVFPGNKSASSWGGPRLEWTADNQGGTKNWPNKGPATIKLEGGLTVKGCMPYKVGIWADNRYQAAWVIRDQVEYTPPAPPTKIEILSDTPINKTSTLLTVRVTESSANNTSGAQVKTTLQDTNGTTYGQSAKHTPGTPQTFTITVNQNTYYTFRTFSTFYYGTNDAYSLQSTTYTGSQYLTKQMEPPAPEYNWNDDRTALVVTIKANSDYVSYMQCKWGYDDSVTSTLWQGNTGSTPVTSQWSQTANIPYPDHGSGQFIYLKLRARYQDNTWEEGDIFAIPVANPILGVAVYAANNKKYIVDVVEHKSDNTVTPLWQNGQRIVKK